MNVHHAKFQKSLIVEQFQGNYLNNSSPDKPSIFQDLVCAPESFGSWLPLEGVKSFTGKNGLFYLSVRLWGEKLQLKKSLNQKFEITHTTAGPKLTKLANGWNVLEQQTMRFVRWLLRVRAKLSKRKRQVQSLRMNEFYDC